MANVTKIEKSEVQERNPIIERAYKALCKRQRNGLKPRIVQDALIELATDLETKNLEFARRLKDNEDTIQNLANTNKVQEEKLEIQDAKIKQLSLEMEDWKTKVLSFKNELDQAQACSVSLNA